MFQVSGNLAALQGSVLVFSHFDVGGPMWTGTGPREERAFVTFDDSFSAAPVIQLSVDLWDVENSANLRLDLTAEDVSRTGFTIVVRTWDDTRIARLGVSWLAIGTAADSDIWDVD